MKLIQIYSAYQAAEALARNEGMTAREAYGIMKLLSALREDAFFFSGKRNELLARYGVEDKEHPGTFTFPEPVDRDKFIAAVKELTETESQIKAEPVTLRGEITGITPAMLEALDGFVTVV